jgi:hypothetical protein
MTLPTAHQRPRSILTAHFAPQVPSEPVNFGSD